MSFLFRCAFWLTVLAFLLPSPEKPADTAQLSAGGIQTVAYEAAQKPEDDIGAGEMLTMAARSAQDVMGFCERNRSICDRGHAVVSHVVDQSLFYGGQAFVWLSEKAREQKQASSSQPAAPASARSAPVSRELAGA